MTTPSSTKLLRPVRPGDVHPEAVLDCESCAAHCMGHVAPMKRWYEDHSIAQLGKPRIYFCPMHAMLEDLDPDWPANQDILARTPVRRKMPLQDVTVDDLFIGKQNGSAPGQTPKGWLWLSLPVNEGLGMYTSVKPSPAVLEIMEAMLYRDFGTNYDQHYYAQVIWVEPNEALISLQYQQLLGYRFVARVPRDQLREFCSRQPFER